MQLRAITYQWGKGRQNENFSAVYENVFEGEGSEWFQKTVAEMVVLLRYLEENVDDPPHWVCTSHSDCVFYESDQVDYRLSEATETRKLTIASLTWDSRNTCAVVVSINLGSLISIAKIHGGDLESSGQLIGEILRGEVTFAAIRK